jgi:hypothetical protein
LRLNESKKTLIPILNCDPRDGHFEKSALSRVLCIYNQIYQDMSGVPHHEKTQVIHGI